MSLPEASSVEPVGVGALAAYFLRLGATGFGGPIALTGHMRRDLVEERRWFTAEEFKEGLALAQLAPGPLAAQLAIYLGWARGRVRGATAIAVAFVAPSLLMVLALAWAYVRWGGLPWMQRAFYGVGAAVIAIIARSAHKLVKGTIGKDALLWGLFALSALVTAITGTEIVWLFLGAGAVAVAWRRRAAHALLPTKWMLTGLAGVAAPATVGTIFLYFAAAGAFVFGSGLAIVPFLHGGVVDKYHWLTEAQFRDAVAVAMLTPGPVVITVGFIGFLVAGLAGGLAASVGVFLPCWFLVVVPAPYFRRFAKNPTIKAFVDGVTAAAVGAIAGAVFVLGRRAITDVPTAAIFAATLGLTFVPKKIPEPLLLLGAALAGILIKVA